MNLKNFLNRTFVTPVDCSGYCIGVGESTFHTFLSDFVDSKTMGIVHCYRARFRSVFSKDDTLLSADDINVAPGKATLTQVTDR